MSNDRLVPKNDDELLHAFADLLGEVIPEDEEEIEALLIEAGLDPAELRQEATQLIRHLRAKTPLDWRHRRDALERADRSHQRAGGDLPADRQGLIERLRQLTSRPGMEKVHAHLRGHKPADLSDEELRSLVQDLEFISRRAGSRHDLEEE